MDLSTLIDLYGISERFMKYCSVNTASDENSPSCPSTSGQLRLGAMLVEELKAMGVDKVNQDEYGYIYAEIEASKGYKGFPAVAFISHLDTSPDLPGACENPKVIWRYGGSDICVDGDNGIIIKVEDNPSLKNYIGDTIIASNGVSLLGADDKAGIAEIMTAVEILINNPEIKHGRVQIIFTPDEEIGRGTDKLDMKRVFAKYGYTIDGGGIGELEFENFNAATMRVSIKGINYHPGEAKGKMINAIETAIHFNNNLPSEMKPELTEGYEGFFHLVKIDGSVEKAEMTYLIREHDNQKFSDMKTLVYEIADRLNAELKYKSVTVKIEDSYYNMKEKITEKIFIVEKAVRAMRESKIEPVIKPIRGGTDGARLSFMGLPCPNIFAGGHNFHSKYEFIPLQSMGKAVEVILRIITGG